MTRAELRLRLLQIAHQPNRGHKQSMEIAKEWEQDFADLTFEDDKPAAAQAKPGPAKKAAA